ncbi:MAG: transposase [Bryobacteraceae bacterium]
MPRNARVVAAGLAYHITQRGTNRDKVFFSVADRSLYLRLLRENLDTCGVRVLAYCLMTNHVHLVVVPEREESLAMLMARVNGRYAQAVNIRRGRCGHLWQARFHSCPLSEQRLWVALRYVEANPCRARMVARPEDYRYSSASAHLMEGRDRSGVLDMEYWRRAGGAETWRELHGAAEMEEHVWQLRKCTYAGRPFGEETFVETLEARFGRKWRRVALVSATNAAR